jgi:hypothetical protein
MPKLSSIKKFRGGCSLTSSLAKVAVANTNSTDEKVASINNIYACSSSYQKRLDMIEILISF